MTATDETGRRRFASSIPGKNGCMSNPPPDRSPPLGDDDTTIETTETVIDTEPQYVTADGLTAVVTQRETIASERRRRRPLDPIALAMGVILLLVVAGGAAWWYLSNESSQTVPEVEGLGVAVALARLEDEDLVPQVRRVPSEGDTGVVIRQIPTAGTEVDEGTRVSLDVSAGPALIDVPNAVGLQEVDARERLVAAELEVATRDMYTERPAGTVVSQRPQAGADVARGTSVTLGVSRGSGRVDVPLVTGLTRANAEAELAAVSLGANVVEVPSSEPEGTVVAQSPSGGVATRGDAVRLNVSAGS